MDSDLDDLIEMETMQFVDPFEVNPIMDPLTVPEDIAPPPQVSATPGYILSENDGSQNKLKMEVFSDLSAIVSAGSTNLDLTGITDELSTPVFDRGNFDFTPSSTTSIRPDENDLKVKVEYNAQYYSCGKTMYTDLTFAARDKVQSKETYSVNVADRRTDSFLYQPNVIRPVYYNDKENDSYDAIRDVTLITSLSNIKGSDSAVASPQDDRYSYISSPDCQMSVPEHYEHSYEVQPKPNSYDVKPKLNLMTEQFKLPIKNEGVPSLNTPDVIDDVVNMGNDFNILDLVNNDDITILNADEELLLSITSPSAISSEPSTPSTTLSKPSSPTKKSSRRRKLSSVDDDDDEEYLPPSSKRKSTVRLADIDIESSNSSEDSVDYVAKKPRGRPPKRAESVSSESTTSDVSKYRELRDKNNEASRRSRLKRKMKEIEYEKEAEELRMKNIRLKAQVEELEKMVSSFRNNLFRILVAK